MLSMHTLTTFTHTHVFKCDGALVVQLLDISISNNLLWDWVNENESQSDPGV